MGSDAAQLRRNVIKDTKRIVIKVGSRLLTGIAGTPKAVRIEELIREIATLRERGYEVILVSSGAIAAGMMLTERRIRPSDIAQLQALAAVGQSRLMSLYESACVTQGFHCAQILLSLDDVKFRRRHLNTRNCINALLSFGILPIINENDTVSVDEIRFGDNDRLAALVGTMIRADMTILLTTVNGLRNRDGNHLTDRIPLVTEIDDEVRALGGDTDDTHNSVGGMRSKLDAAEMVMAAGESLWIANGENFAVLHQILDGEDVGTLFVPSSPQLSGSKRFLAFFADPCGSITIDKGAVKALRNRGKSLLPSGIVKVEGVFDKGDTVQVVDESGHPVAIGSCNYTSVDLDRIKGLRSDAIREVLHEHDAYDEAIHRNNMSVI